MAAPVWARTVNPSSLLAETLSGTPSTCRVPNTATDIFGAAAATAEPPAPAAAEGVAPAQGDVTPNRHARESTTRWSPHTFQCRSGKPTVQAMDCTAGAPPLSP